jgi:hypothetical protein
MEKIQAQGTGIIMMIRQNRKLPVMSGYAQPLPGGQAFAVQSR